MYKTGGIWPHLMVLMGLKMESLDSIFTKVFMLFYKPECHQKLCEEQREGCGNLWEFRIFFFFFFFWDYKVLCSSLRLHSKYQAVRSWVNIKCLLQYEKTNKQTQNILHCGRAECAAVKFQRFCFHLWRASVVIHGQIHTAHLLPLDNLTANISHCSHCQHMAVCPDG